LVCIQNAAISIYSFLFCSYNAVHRWDIDAPWVHSLSDGSGSVPPRFGSFVSGASAFDAGTLPVFLLLLLFLIALRKRSHYVKGSQCMEPGRLLFGLKADTAQYATGAFGTSPSEAALMDPQQRLLMECVAETLLPVKSQNAQGSLLGLPQVCCGVSATMITHVLL